MITKLNQLFRKRIGISQSENISFDMLEQILEKTACSIPFENTSIISGNSYNITKESLITKILTKNQGGLCYDLNPILYFFLLENGFHARLVRGVVYNELPQRWSPTGNTHVVILLTHDNQSYLIDTGFGASLPLKPVPLDGKVIESANGEFRIIPAENDFGDFILEIKLRHKDMNWRIGYIFNSKHPVKDVSELDEVKQIISQHPESSFNKKFLVSMLTDKGNITLTDTSFTQYMNGNVKKEAVDPKTFKEIAKNYFSLSV